ncbi:MAG: histidinol-phosphatase [Bacteroidales bacterium]|nr:histidinol-phosphatase [Bacteroidales bacterium]
MTIPKANYHTHSLYCDGKEPLESYVRAAETRHFEQLGFSSHAPVPFENDFGITLEQIPAYCAEIEHLKQNTNVQLLKALECDFIPGMSTPFRQFKEQFQLDYIIGGVHLVRPPHRDGLWFIDGSKREIYDDGLRNLFDGNVQQAVTTFWEQTFEMLETEQMDVIAHFDKIKMHNQHRFFQEDEKWYRILAEKALQLIKNHDIVIEINTRGIYKGRCDAFYPSTELLTKACQMDIPVIISSDAHKSDELDLLFHEAVTELQRCGYGNLVSFDPVQKRFV